MSIKTQAIDDWTAKTWTDFVWSSETTCPEGFEAIGNTWAGTYPANFTDNQITVVTQRSKYATDYEKIPAKFQTRLFTSMRDIMCGKRGAPSLADAKMAKQTGSIYHCPSGLTACSSNIDVGGATYCVDAQKDELCPITELHILSASQYAASSLKNDRRYETSSSSEVASQDD